MDVKGAFNHVSKGQLIARMMKMGVDRDLIKWTKSFLTDCKVQLVIDGHENLEQSIETGIPQGSLVSPILFLIYISGVFDEVAEVVPDIISFNHLLITWDL